MRYVVPLMLALAFIFLAYYFPPFGADEFLGRSRSISEYYVEESSETVGSLNIVESVVWAYRGYDTLGEVTILFTAVLAISLLGGSKL